MKIETKNKIKKYTKRIFMAGLGIYLISFVNMYDSIKTDYTAQKKKNFETGKITNTLLVENVMSRYKGECKCITLYSETHYYNEYEHKKGVELLKDYNEVFFESGTENQYYNSLKGLNYLFMGAQRILFKPLYKHYNGLSVGRDYPNIANTAELMGIPVHQLENPNDTITNLPFSYKLDELTSFFRTLFVGPWEYANLIEEITVEDLMNHEPSKEFFEVVLKKRDPIMAHSIANEIAKSRENDLLIGFGFSHRRGIIEHLINKEGVHLYLFDSKEECKESLKLCDFSYLYYEY